MEGLIFATNVVRRVRQIPAVKMRHLSLDCDKCSNFATIVGVLLRQMQVATNAGIATYVGSTDGDNFFLASSISSSVACS